MGKATARYKSHLVTCVVVVRDHFVGVTLLCLGEFLHVARQVKADWGTNSR